MTQVIIEGTVYPEATGNDGSYVCQNEILSRQLEMISGDLVEEEVGEVAVISYSYKYFDDDFMRKCLSDLRKKRVVNVLYRSPDSPDLKSGKFLCISPPDPEYYMSIGKTIYWTNISFTLREVKPHA